MDPREFQQLAEELLRVGRPAHCRSAISRAYYGLFQVACGLLRHAGVRVSESAAGHGEVMQFLLGRGHPIVARIGGHLGTLRGMRNDADYKLSKPATENPKTVETVVKGAGKYIRELDSAFGGPDGPAIVAGIMDYQRKIAGKQP